MLTPAQLNFCHTALSQSHSSGKADLLKKLSLNPHKLTSTNLLDLIDALALTRDNFDRKRKLESDNGETDKARLAQNPKTVMIDLLDTWRDQPKAVDDLASFEYDEAIDDIDVDLDTISVSSGDDEDEYDDEDGDEYEGSFIDDDDIDELSDDEEYAEDDNDDDDEIDVDESDDIVISDDDKSNSE